MKKIISLGATLGFLALLALPAMAQLTGPPASAPINTWQEMVNVIFNLRNWIYGIFLVLAVVFFVVAAFEFFTAGGDSTKLQTAKNRFMYGIVALFIVAMSVGMFTLIQNLLGTAAKP